MLYRMPEIHMGTNAIDELPIVLDDLEVKKLFIVTGPHVSKSEPFIDLIQRVKQNGREVCVFNETSADPSFELIETIATQSRAFGSDCVLGFGGGSPLDAAKAVNILTSYEIPVSSLVGTNNVPQRKIPLLMIPTTAGTASEVTIYSVLTNKKAGVKEAICSSEMIPDYAFLIPEVTYSMPPSITAATGMDALCHACEAYVSKRNNSYSDVMALAAIRLIAKYLPIAYREPQNTEAREQMLQASLFAGLAFRNSSVTAIHAFAYPLGGLHSVPHGVANSLMFEAIFNHSIKGNVSRIQDIAEAFTGIRDSRALIPAIKDLKNEIGLPASLKTIDIPEADIEPMAESVIKIKRLLDVNPVPITLEDAKNIYRFAWEGI